MWIIGTFVTAVQLEIIQALQYILFRKMQFSLLVMAMLCNFKP